MKALLVSSQGGHLTQLLALRPWWSRHERLWVVPPTADVEERLLGEELVWSHHPTTRNVGNLARNANLARKVLDEFRPDVVVSTGAGVAVPFFWQARRRGAATVFIEVYDRVDSKTLTGRLCRPATDLFLTQWDEQQAMWPGSVMLGRLL